MSWLPRWMHRAYARLGGYFWLPCPLCGQYSGGHEWRDRDGKSSTIQDPETAWNPNRSAGLGICPACTRAGKGDVAWRSVRG
jgi:hypothetical protein